MKNIEARLSIGDTIRHPVHKWGVVKQIDKSNLEFFYLVDFRGNGGDGTLAWLSKSYAEKKKREKRSPRPRKTEKEA